MSGQLNAALPFDPGHVVIEPCTCKQHESTMDAAPSEGEKGWRDRLWDGGKPASRRRSRVAQMGLVIEEYTVEPDTLVVGT